MSPEGVNVRHTDRIWIGGEWVRAHSGRMIELVSPDTEEVIGAVAEADEEDMNAAVAAARAAFDVGPWSELRPPERIACLKRMAQHLHGRTGEIARAWTAQMGGLASFAAPMTAGSTQALEQIIAAAETFTFVETRTSPVVKSAIVAHEPVGVVAAIAPWNAPYGIMAEQGGLRAGRRLHGHHEAVARNARSRPTSSPKRPRRRACRRAWSTWCCGRARGEPTTSSATRASTRSASPARPRRASASPSVCGERIARCTLELGGKSAAIVRDDFPTEAAAKHPRATRSP